MSAHQQSSLRLLAPAALVVFAIVFLIVVVGSLGDDESSSPAERPTTSSARQRDRTQTREQRQTTSKQDKPRFYVVRAGDNLALIADKTGVTLEQLRELNPTLDPQGLVTGQRVRLRGSSAGATGTTGPQSGTGTSQGGVEQ
jgi:LysM repeat protein